jgi:methionyl-tRNA synthetase
VRVGDPEEQGPVQDGLAHLLRLEQEPWKVAKDESEAGQARLATILYTAAEALRATAVLLNPLMPTAAQKLWDSLGAADELGSLASQTIGTVADWGRLPAGATVHKGDILFPRLEEKPAA